MILGRYPKLDFHINLALLLALVLVSVLFFVLALVLASAFVLFEVLSFLGGSRRAGGQLWNTPIVMQGLAPGSSTTLWTQENIHLYLETFMCIRN
jgi:hypothetical protein